LVKIQIFVKKARNEIFSRICCSQNEIVGKELNFAQNLKFRHNMENPKKKSTTSYFKLRIKQLQQAQQHDVTTEIAIRKLNLRVETNKYINSQFLQRTRYKDYQAALDVLTERRMKMCEIWYNRWMTRKKDWNDTRNQIRSGLSAIANRLGISQTKQDEMLTELSMKVIEIRQEFEISLDNAFRDAKDDLVPSLKKDLRDHLAELLRITDDRRTKSVNVEQRLVNRLAIIARV